jgi:Cu/Ag efflux protein CusF
LVSGEVTSIDSSAKQFKVKADDGVNYTIALQDNTAYLRMPFGEKDQKKAAKIELSDIAVGDRLIARGPLAEDTKTVTVRTVIVMTKDDVAKKQQQDHADWQKRGIAGTVTAVSPEAKEITVNLHGRDAKSLIIEAGKTSFRRYAPESVRFADAKPSSFAELRVGDTVRALGDKNEDGSRLKAEELVSGTFQTIAGTVISVNTATGEVQLMDLKTKKPVTVRTNPSSMLRRLEERTAMMLARRMNPPADGAAGTPGGAPAGGSPRTLDAPREGGAPGGPGGGMRGGGNFDLQMILERSPQLALTELKKGDALIVSSTKGADGSLITAISLVAGVEPFLAAAPRRAGQVDLGSWSLGMGAPEQ